MTLEYHPPTAADQEKWLNREPAYFQFLPDDISRFYREMSIGPFSEPRWRNEAGVDHTIIVDLLSRILAKL